MKIITVATIKGGTGKTTTAGALAQACRKHKKKVLCIDLDPQGDFSNVIGGGEGQALELVQGEPYQVQTIEPGLDLIGSTPELATLKSGRGSAYRLRDALEPIKNNYDFIIIDTPPQISEITYNALCCSTNLIIPLECDMNALHGFEMITDMAERLNDKLTINAIICRYDARPKFNRFMRDTIAEETKGAYLGEVRNGVAIREAQAFQESVFEYAPKSKPAEDYEKIYKKIK